MVREGGAEAWLLWEAGWQDGIESGKRLLASA